MMRQIVTLLMVMMLGVISSEIEVTFSNEDDDEQIFIVKTDNLIQNRSGSLSPNDASSDAPGLIAVLKILKGDVVLLEKTTTDIGRDGLDMDIHSDLLDTGENELDLLLLSVNGSIIQQEKIIVLSPPLHNGDEEKSSANSSINDLNGSSRDNESADSGNNSDSAHRAGDKSDDSIDSGRNDDENSIHNDNADDDSADDESADSGNNSDSTHSAGDKSDDSIGSGRNDGENSIHNDCADNESADRGGSDGVVHSDSSVDEIIDYDGAEPPSITPTPLIQTYLWRQTCSSLYARMRAVVSTSTTTEEGKYRRLVTVAATCGTVGVAAGGAWGLYALRRKPPPPPPSSDKPTSAGGGGGGVSLSPPRDLIYRPPQEAQEADNVEEKKSPYKYKSTFPRYPLAAATPTPIDFTSPKAFASVKSTTKGFTSSAPPPSAAAAVTRGGGGSSLVSDVRDLLLGRVPEGQLRRPKSTTLLLQGGVALLGAQAAKTLITQWSRARSRSSAHNAAKDDEDKMYNNARGGSGGGSMFLVSRSKVKKRWSLGRLLRRL